MDLYLVILPADDLIREQSWAVGRPKSFLLIFPSVLIKPHLYLCFSDSKQIYLLLVKMFIIIYYGTQRRKKLKQ